MKLIAFQNYYRVLPIKTIVSIKTQKFLKLDFTEKKNGSSFFLVKQLHQINFRIVLFLSRPRIASQVRGDVPARRVPLHAQNIGKPRHLQVLRHQQLLADVQ